MPQEHQTEVFHLSPVGVIHREDDSITIEIFPAFRPGLKELETFSHVLVFWWFSKFDDEGSRQTTQFDRMPFDAPRLGVFSCRSPLRPNPIALSTVKILNVDHQNGLVNIADIDAYDNTPALDLKAYLPHCDRVKDVKLPGWAEGWTDWLPENGLGLED
jgi:tRNA-Thr(GGU) m(6)t(6)A37 methyltransferase TsaA